MRQYATCTNNDAGVLWGVETRKLNWSLVIETLGYLLHIISAHSRCRRVMHKRSSDYLWMINCAARRREARQQACPLFRALIVGHTQRARSPAPLRGLARGPPPRARLLGPLLQGQVQLRMRRPRMNAYWMLTLTHRRRAPHPLHNHEFVRRARRVRGGRAGAGAAGGGAGAKARVHPLSWCMSTSTRCWSCSSYTSCRLVELDARMKLI